MTLRFGILTISDRSTRGERPDSAGPALAEVIQSYGWQVTRRGLIPDDFATIETTLRQWINTGDLDILLTTGGTGFSPRDITPEATRRVIERPAPGLAEAMRAAGMQKTPFAILSRGEAGICKQTLLLNLPGSPKGAIENLQAIIAVLEHAVHLLQDHPLAESGHQANL